MKTYKNNKENSKSSQGIAGFIRIKWLIIVIIVIIAAATAFGLTIYGKINSSNPGENISTFTARRDDLLVTVTEGGSIKARKTIDIKCEVEAGREGATILSIVPEGTYITQEDVDNGKVIVQLDSAEMEEELTQREIDFASADASFSQAKESYTIQRNQNESDITAAELKVKFALMDLQKYLGEDKARQIIEDVNNGLVLNTSYINSLLEDPNVLEGSGAEQRLKELGDSIIQTEQSFTLAQDKLVGTKRLHEAQYVSDLDLRQDELNVTSSELRKERDEVSLDLFKRYDFPKQAEKLLSDYNEAKRELERTHARCRSRLSQAQAQLKSSESRYQSRKSRLDKTIRQLELSIIKAPAPGLVIYGSGSDDHWRRMRGSGIIAEGESVYEHQTIITMPDTADMIAQVYVHETSVDKVRPGQRATIVLGPFPDQTFRGEVLKVAPLPNQERGWFNPDLKVYTTEVSIEGTYDYLKPGMSAKVEILVEQLEDVMIVPVQTVANQGGKKVSYCLTPRGIERREVQTGSFSDTFVQIIDGLEVGEKVLLSPPRMTEAKATEFEPESKATAEYTTEAKTESSSETKDRRTPRQGQGFELTDEAIERRMGRLEQQNPEKAEELKQLQQSDPEKFKAELRKLMQEQMQKAMQERGGDSRRQQGGSDDMRRRGGGDARAPEDR